ncbi:Ribosomal RNA small subunit methyltransferase E [Anaerovibrio sp. JC8]|uniref:16S rRNA (uracil(1498)-N(3))-methyltransferase n=1 Tax=Anaerovibrio sp. JC8 TaxID=1240085 RepID=UPI000A0ACBA9|nr:16S rRNA (uracil(1498)-N(3))-methyltransferase [Anaerovibrio sp. JC8]ORU01496.1 Ribosomal RNA small subunit methyltransferase E [Anaerovibrio sp. JC8]
MRRIFISDLLKENITITGADAHHLSRVMRAKAGDHIVVADDEGRVGEYVMTGFTEDSVAMELVNYIDENTESPVEIILAQCLPKGDKLELITQKATELGINTIVPLSSDNCVVRYDAKKARVKQEKWQKNANEAGKQCGRSCLPTVQEIQPLQKWLEEMATQQEDIAICMCYENEEQTGIKEFLASSGQKRFAVVIGPEGGFSLAEAEKARQLGIPSVSLGTRILRAETAAISAMTIIQYEKGDLGGRS